jgi:hypothetical protein
MSRVLIDALLGEVCCTLYQTLLRIIMLQHDMYSGKFD